MLRVRLAVVKNSAPAKNRFGSAMVTSALIWAP